MKKNWRFVFLALLIMAIMTMAAACAPAKEETANPADEESSGEVQETGETEEPGKDEQDDSEEPTDTDEQVTDEEPTEVEPGTDNESVGGDDEDANVQTVKGTFGGLADPHTFELKTNEVPEGVMAFQFYDEEMGAKLADMEDGQELTVVYTTNEHGQNLAESIK
ncbi:hypothetical protein [Niallia endozanthoxylica]|uniref:DUF1344 domain-containing protein n=1 Tax=Niallia endozanthoxylica TaxID=2036016 RepID=A0A5J5I4F2_9BACI|nr:hypothetical protein [Niallia endozanthoxylica]KAA9029962.1 hypothetical protein F4V44_02865 [Niallia endozanthoxylica]